MPRTTAAAAPPEEPPGVMRVSQGLRVTPVNGLSVTAFQPNSGMVVLPMMIAPCSRSRATAGASCAAGAAGVSFEPKRAGMPATRRLSLMPTGTPSIRPRGAPARQRASDSLALRERALAIDPAKGVHRAVVAIDPVEHGAHHLDRRERLAAIAREQLRGRQERGVIVGSAGDDARSSVAMRSYLTPKPRTHKSDPAGHFNLFDRGVFGVIRLTGCLSGKTMLLRNATPTGGHRLCGSPARP